MKDTHNRVEKELDQWLKREQRFKTLFSFALDTNRAFLREKLRYYHSLALKYKGIATADEKLTLTVLRQERKAMEKQLYPNLLARLIYKMTSGIVQGGTAIRDRKRYAVSERELKESLQKLGFPEITLRMEHKDKEQFTLPISYYTGENQRMEVDLSVQRDGQGRYRLEGFKATLHRDGEPGKDKSHYFKLGGENQIGAKQAFNLLSGRSVAIGKGQNMYWMQLDFNDRDAQGNYQVKRFYPGYGYDLEKALRQLPIRELNDPEQTRQLLGDLKNGMLREVTLMDGTKQQRILIEANPQFKTLNLYNKKGRKISKSRILEGSPKENTRLKNNVKFRVRPTQKNGLRLH